MKKAAGVLGITTRGMWFATSIGGPSVDEFTTTGPLFDGRASILATEAALRIQAALVAEGQKLAVQFFSEAIRVNDGVFTGSIAVTDSSTTEIGAVTTDIATYGPWLEGTGSRNQTTRFKGYHGFRQATQVLNDEAASVAEEVLEPFVLGMNL